MTERDWSLHDVTVRTKVSPQSQPLAARAAFPSMVPGRSSVTGSVDRHDLCTLVQIEPWVTVSFCKTHERWVVLIADECPQDIYDAAVTVLPEGTELVDWGEMDARDYMAFAEVRSSELESASVRYMS